MPKPSLPAKSTSAARASAPNPVASLGADVFAQVRRLEIRTRHIVDDLVGGAYHSVFKGRGMEFQEVREYQEGDEVRTIDWNVTARLGHPFVKKFVEERELTVNLLVDISASGDAGAARRLNESAAKLAALLALSAIRNNDRVGLLLFSDRDELHLPPRKGRGHVLRLIRDLLAFKRTSRRTDIKAALEHLVRANPRRTVTFLVSDFLDAADYEPALRLANRRHDVVAIRVHDAAAATLPALGQLTVEDAETGEWFTIPSSSGGPQAAFASAVADHAERTAAICRRCRVDLVEIAAGADEDYVGPLMAFFARREGRKRHG